MDTAVSVRNVSKTFYIPFRRRNTLREYFINFYQTYSKKKLKVLDDINFDVDKGEFVGIIGKNGCGKSTLLRIMAGIYKSDKGGIIKAEGKIAPFLDLGVGFNYELTARENIYLNAIILGLTKKEITKRFNKIVEFAGINNFVDQQLKYFSSGMQVRLAFAIIIQIDADVLLLDEIIAVGDAEFNKKCFAVFDEYKRESKTIVLVSHDMSAIKRFCDKVILIDEGKVAKIGAPDEVVDFYLKNR